MYVQAEFTIILCTGRREDNRSDTVQWLNNFNIDFDHLFMRSTNDRRPDYIVKHEIYKTFIEPNYLPVVAVYEDRTQVVEMWRDLGLTCLQVQKGDY